MRALFEGHSCQLQCGMLRGVVLKKCTLVPLWMDRARPVLFQSTIPCDLNQPLFITQLYQGMAQHRTRELKIPENNQWEPLVILPLIAAPTRTVVIEPDQISCNPILTNWQCYKYFYNTFWHSFVPRKFTFLLQCKNAITKQFFFFFSLKK